MSTTSTITNNTAATIRIIVVPSMSNLPVDPNHLKLHQWRMNSGTLTPKRQGSPSVTLAPASGARLHRWVRCAPRLLDAGAAALNQYNENDGKENAGYNANQKSAVHLKTPFMGPALKIIPSQPVGGFESPGSQRGGCIRVAQAVRPVGGALLAGLRQKIRTDCVYLTRERRR